MRANDGVVGLSCLPLQGCGRTSVMSAMLWLSEYWIAKILSEGEQRASAIPMSGCRHSTLALCPRNFWGDRNGQARVVVECNIQCPNRPFSPIYITFYRLQAREYRCCLRIVIPAVVGLRAPVSPIVHPIVHPIKFDDPGCLRSSPSIYAVFNHCSQHPSEWW